jgi:hypothetical protein
MVRGSCQVRLRAVLRVVSMYYFGSMMQAANWSVDGRQSCSISQSHIKRGAHQNSLTAVAGTGPNCNSFTSLQTTMPWLSTALPARLTACCVRQVHMRRQAHLCLGRQRTHAHFPGPILCAMHYTGP